MKNKKSNNYILVLPSWYPSKLDAFNGDFNERLVQAASNYNFQIVIYVTTKRNYKDKFDKYEFSENNNIITYKAYYPFSKWFLGNILLMTRLYLTIFKEVFNKYGLPKLVHTYVFLPAGIISFYLKHRYGLKVILTEHWSFFNISRSDNINNHPFYKKWIYKGILNSFDSIILISKNLRDSISKWTPHIKKHVLPNVVDTRFFNNENSILKEEGEFTFIHVSNMTSNKNVISIINTFIKVAEHGYPSKLILVGQQSNSVNTHLDKLTTYQKQRIIYEGELSYEEVAKWMKRSHAFILFSYYENMPCVLLESLCCGLPIISSNVGGISEVVNEENGILVESGNNPQLEDAMVSMIKNYNKYNRQEIASNAINLYGYQEIGKKINEVYLELENKK